MDLKKAQRLLHKIEAFLDNGNAQELSRLEKDLIRSYVLQLYDVVTDEVSSHEPEEEKPIKFVEHKMPVREPAPKIEVPQAKEFETTKPFQPDFGTSSQKEKPVEVPVRMTQKPSLPVETKSFQYREPEPVKETIQPVKTNQSSSEVNEELVKLFDLPKTDEMSGRFTHIPITSIESAMGLNERIFTLNELFGGDKALFDSTCNRLNHLGSYAEAKTMLMNGPAKDFRWTEPERLKMAEQFVRIVSRRYPKSVS